MSIPLSGLVTGMVPSPTIAIKAVADELTSKVCSPRTLFILQGEEVFDFGVGEMSPYFQVPQVMKDATTAALQNNQTHYISPQGDPELLDALSQDFDLNFGLQFSKEEVCIVPGPKPGLYIAMATILDPNAHRNRVAIFSPAYESFRDLTLFITHKPAIILETDENCTLASRDDIACIIINSPNNPSGAVYPTHLLKGMADIVKKYPGLVVITDEVYRTITYGDVTYSSIAHFIPEQTVVVGGLSKEVAGTGLRLGFIAAPKYVIKEATKLIGTMVSCVNVPTQKGYAAFLKSDKDMAIRREFVQRLTKKRDTIVNLFQTLPGFESLEICAPDGAFYFFPNFNGYLGKKTAEGETIETDEALSLYLLKEAKVAMLAGSHFGKPGRLRLAFAAASDEHIEKGIKGMALALSKLQ